MKILISVFFLSIHFVAACQNKDTSVTMPSGNKYSISLNVLPKPVGFVSDFSNLYTEDEEITLDSLIKSFEKRKDVQIAVVTIPGGYLSKDESLEKYTLRLANTWGVGKQDANRGILIGISTDLREMRIQNGYGIERIITDYDTKQIVDDYFIPYLKQGEYFKATYDGLVALMEKLIKKGA